MHGASIRGSETPTRSRPTSGNDVATQLSVPVRLRHLAFVFLRLEVTLCFTLSHFISQLLAAIAFIYSSCQARLGTNYADWHKLRDSNIY